MTIPNRNFNFPTSIKFGAGRIKELAEHCKANGMGIRNQSGRLTQIAQQSARDNQRLVGTNAVGVSGNGLEALGCCHLRVGQVGAVGGAAFFVH